MATIVTSASVVELLNSNSANEVGDAITRGAYSQHFIQSVCSGAAATVTIQISIDGVSWLDTDDTIVGNAGLLLNGVYPFIRAKRDGTTRPVVVTIYSSGAFSATPATYEEGFKTLTMGVQAVTVPFTSDFGAAPSVVIPLVINTTDATPLIIVPSITAITKDDFTVWLSAPPNSGNYQLKFIAGAAAVLFHAIARDSKRLSEYDETLAGLLDTDYLMLVKTGITPKTTRVTLGTVKTLFPTLAAVPASAAAPGHVNQIAIDSNFIYTYDGVLWGRTARDTSWP